jgi:hypothetical protein
LRAPLRKVLLLAALLTLVGAATASGIGSCFGPVCVSATATLQPRELPKHGNAPVTLNSVVRVNAHDGSTPPTLQRLEFLFDKHGTVDAKGLPVCTIAKLEGTTPSQARKRCAGALVGKGTSKVLVSMPGQAPFKFTSPISFFNGPPTGGKPTLIAHGYETVPAPKALLVPIVIERIGHGRYGFRARIEMPEIADGYGAPLLAEATIGATRKRDGRKVGYINAHCAGGRLQVYGTMRATNGDFFPATLTSPCHTPG